MMAVSQRISELENVVQESDRTACVKLLFGQLYGGITYIQTVTMMEILRSGFCAINVDLIFSAMDIYKNFLTIQQK